MDSDDSDEAWIREGGTLHDPFHLVFIRKALQDVPWMKDVVFGLNGHACSLLPDSPEHNDPISKLFKGYGESWCIRHSKVFTPHNTTQQMRHYS